MMSSYALLLGKFLRTLPDDGKSYLTGGACRHRNIFVQRQRMRDVVNNVDLVSRALRRSICKMYRVYSIPAPNSFWLSVQRVHDRM